MPQTEEKQTKLGGRENRGRFKGATPERCNLWYSSCSIGRTGAPPFMRGAPFDAREAEKKKKTYIEAHQKCTGVVALQHSLARKAAKKDEEIAANALYDVYMDIQQL